jgi:hypothetical protein
MESSRRIFLAALLLLLLLSSVARAEQSLSCQSVSFKVALNAGEDYQLELGGGLLFRVMSEKEPGWFIDVVPAEANTKDYVYPVNLPLRLNPNQTLGPGYGETVKSSLSHPHEMNFLLDRNDYDRIFGLVEKLLSSYQTPDKLLSDYNNAVDDARKGWLRVRISNYKTDPRTGSLTHIKFRVEIVTPADFQFAPGVNPWPAQCHR